ncbi:MAG: citrate synthase [bacterium]
MEDKATLSYGGKSYELSVVTGSEGEKALDIAQLRSKTGLITLDPGYMNSGSCKSAIAFIDGEKGILSYRGYPIAELAAKSTFLEVSYLLIHGELPTAGQYRDFVEGVRYHTMLHEYLKRLFEGFPREAHPMAVCSAVIAALSTFYQDSLDPLDEDQVRITIFRLLAKLPTIAACSYKHSIGQPVMYPNNSLDYAENLLYMMFATPCETYTPNPVVAKAIDLLLVLHADHEQNCSTSTVRLVGSSYANLFSSISAGVSALWGPLHGGANQKVIEMLEYVAREEGNAEKFLEKCKDKNDTTRLMGFGHRVYKSYDPRASIIKKSCREVLDSLGVSSHLLDIAMDLEEIVLRDDYFISRKLYPNVDFYSGLIYQAIGIPVNMFTVFFAMGRLPGWIAQWQEMVASPDFKIGRPRQLYVGATERHYVPIGERGTAVMSGAR